MSRLILNTGAAPSAPASGKQSLWSDTGAVLRAIDATGKIITLAPITNYSTTSQAPAATTRTYLTGSALTVPSGKLQIGSQFTWRWNMTKTAAGSAASTIDVAVGTAGTTSDTAVLSFTKPAGTAAADEGWCTLNVICRGPLSASGVFVGEFTMIHNLSATGHMTIPAACVNTVSSSFDVTTASLILGVCITTGASDAITIQQVFAHAANL
jgi:hypothetical protein